MRVIINADDLGSSTSCNNVIFDLLRKERITSATIMANCPGTEDAVRRAKDFTNCSFGVHLNATTLRPLRDDPALKALLNADGCFSRDVRTKRLDASARKALSLEFAAQIDRIGGAGISISHIDSHHHVHNSPSLFPVLKSVQRRYGIRKVRISQNIYLPHMATRRLLFKKRLYNWALRNVYATKTTDGFTSLRTFFQIPQRAELPLETVELMVHPGPAAYEEETQLLRSGWLDDVPGIRKITYKDL
jgi:predicted glycoside hydrolase/deacetylase ChbG (UPF0249 family)